jgi:mRNA-degrading endonuclease YafQ of YafQ-DinJ toxin-antitoxin module
LRRAKRYLKKHPEAQSVLDEAFARLEADAYDPVLKTHRLQGELQGMLACSAGYDLRILFKIVDHEGSEAILLLSIGTHDEVY